MTAPGQPVWQRVATAIAEDIRSGRLKVGDRIPTAAALAERHGVSRSTALKAIAELQAHGILTGEPGRAVVVTGEPAAPAPTPEVIAQQVDGLAETVRDLSEKLGAHEAHLLELYDRLGYPRPGAETKLVRRRRTGTE